MIFVYCMELTKVLKAKQAPQPVQTDDEYEEAIRIHEEQLARQSAEITAKQIEFRLFFFE